MSVVSVRDLAVSYSGAEALTGVSFTLEDGDFVGLAGPNGSGKSTLVKTILGLAKPDHGSIDLFGMPQAKFRAWKRIGFLPQRSSSILPGFPATAAEIVSQGLIAGKSFPKRLTAADHGRIDQALDFMGILNLKATLIGEMSGGQQQRVFLARALAGRPDLLILDEPTAALDPDTRERLFDVIVHLNRTHRVTIILVTHDVGTIGLHATKLMYLDKRVVFFGTFAEFCASEEMRAFFGPSSQHMICHTHDNVGDHKQ